MEVAASQQEEVEGVVGRRGQNREGKQQLLNLNSNRLAVNKDIKSLDMHASKSLL